MSAFTIKDIQAILKALRYDDKTTRHKTLIDSGNKNKLTIIGENMPENWLDGVCNYTGPGADLPVGGYSKIPNWYPEKIVKSWTVIDSASDEGDIAEKKGKELLPGDIIIGATMNVVTLKAIVGSYGADFYQIKDANGNSMTLDQWQAKYGSNGLGLVAIRNMRKKISGGGIHV
jgi:hypothetical protein